MQLCLVENDEMGVRRRGFEHNNQSAPAVV